MRFETGFCVVEVGTDEISSCLGLDFDERVGTLTYDVVSFIHCFSNESSSDVGLEGNEAGFLALETTTFIAECTAD